MFSWHPVNDIWDNYQSQLEDAAEEDLDNKSAEDIIWPSNLHLGDDEKEDIQKFVEERTKEMLRYMGRKSDNRVIASYIFRSLLAGLIWQKQRQGE